MFCEKSELAAIGIHHSKKVDLTILSKILN